MTTQTTLDSLLARFAAADCSWISSMRPDGRVHSVPVWHCWAGGQAYVVTKVNAVKVGNIASNPHVVIALPDPLDPFIIEGVAAVRPIVTPVVAALFKAKYDWDPTTDAGYSAQIEIAPSKVIAWGKYGEGRWTAADVQELYVAH